jgi:hypothetical protein
MCHSRASRLCKTVSAFLPLTRLSVKQIIEGTSLPILKLIMPRRLLSDGYVLICTTISTKVSQVPLSSDHTLMAFAATSASTDTPGTSNNGDFGGPSATSLNQLASQLTQWRSMLPRDLQWTEDEPEGFPSPQASGGYGQPVDPTLSPQRSRSSPPLFTTDLNSEPVHYPYVYDIQVALLRTRYYYAKYMVHRPFVYKALHFPEQMTQEDAQGVAECLRVSFHSYTSELSPFPLGK